MQIQFTTEQENTKEEAKVKKRRWSATATRHKESTKESTMLSQLDNTIHLQEKDEKEDKGG